MTCVSITVTQEETVGYGVSYTGIIDTHSASVCVCLCVCGAGIINVVGSEICSHVMGTRLPHGCTQAVKLRLHLQEINAVCVSCERSGLQFSEVGSRP